MSSVHDLINSTSSGSSSYMSQPGTACASDLAGPIVPAPSSQPPPPPPPPPPPLPLPLPLPLPRQPPPPPLQPLQSPIAAPDLAAKPQATQDYASASTSPPSQQPHRRQQEKQLRQGQPPQPISRWGFEYNGTLTWKGVVRRDAAYLKSICFPEQESDLAVRKRAQEEAAKTLTIKFITAQLNHYGVQFPPGIKRDSLLSWLKNALARGQCEKVPEYVQERIQGMVRDFEPRREAYDAWKRAETKRERRERFDSLPTVAMQVNYDIELFMEAYFTDDAGHPAPHKWPATFTLTNVVCPHQVIDAVSKVPNLYFTWSQLHSNRTLFIGWSHPTVLQARETYDATIGRQRKIERDARGRHRAARHREYLEVIDRTQVRQEFGLVGSYVLFCDAIEEQAGFNPGMTVDIFERANSGTYDGVFRFSVLSGVFILKPDAKEPDILDLDERQRFGPAGLFETELEEHQPPPPQKMYANPNRPAGMPFSSPHGQHTLDCLEPTGLTSTGGASSKRRASRAGLGSTHRPSKKPKTPFSNNAQKRFTVTWRGRDAEGEVPSEYPQEDDGWIEFDDGRYGVFAGIINMAFMGGEKKVQGYKVSDVPRRLQAGH